MRLKYKSRVLIVATGAMFSTQVARLIISPVVPDIIAAFSISKGLIGIALTGVGIASALSQFPSGVLGEQFGERKVILASLGLSGLGCLLLALAPTFLMFAVAALLLGAGAGSYFIVGVSLLDKLFERTGQALGFHAAGAPLAGLIAPVGAAIVASRFNWRVALLGGAGVVFSALLLVYWQVKRTNPTRPQTTITSRLTLTEIREIVWKKPILYTMFLGTVAVFSWTAFITFFPTFLTEYWLLTTQRASIVFGVAFALSTLALPVVGRLSDALGRDLALAGSLLFSGLGLAVFLFLPPSISVFVGTLVLGFGLSWGGVLQARIMEEFDQNDRGAGFGLVRTGYILPGSIGSAITGVIADNAGWVPAYGLIVVLLVLAAGTLIVNQLFGFDL